MKIIHFSTAVLFCAKLSNSKKGGIWIRKRIKTEAVAPQKKT
jgi:hypothetical protein